MVDEQEQESEENETHYSESYLIHEYGEKVASIVAYCKSPQKISYLSQKFNIEKVALRFALKRLIRQGIMRAVETDSEEVPLYQTVKDVKYPPIKEQSDQISMRESEIRIALVGSIGAGKTSILHSLLTPPINTSHYQRIRRHNIPEHVFKTSKHIAFFNIFTRIEGQLRFLKVIKPHLIILVTDSTVNDISKLKDYLPRIQELFPKVKLIAYANKQDLPDAIPPELVQEELKIPTFGIVGFDISNKQRISLTQVIADSLGLTLDTLGKTGQWSCSRSFPRL